MSEQLELICPACETSHRVAACLMSAEGLRARCGNCGARFQTLPNRLAFLIEPDADVDWPEPEATEEGGPRSESLTSTGPDAPAIITSSKRDILAPVEIHGWEAEAVQERQRCQAEALGIPVIFRDQLADGGQGPEIVLIPSGYYLMGSPEDEPEGDEYERPQHVVTIPSPFAIGRYALTFAEWDSYADRTGAYRPDDDDWGRGSRPVINVSWEDAQDYLRWLTDQTGQNYRLPSEAEWEYACRAGTTTRFNAGHIITTDQANFNGERPADGCPNGHRLNQTLPVGSYLPNPFKLHEMHGNVQEWVADCWNKNYLDAPHDGSAWMSGNCNCAVVRGGNFGDAGAQIRSAHRDYWPRDERGEWDGFRVARSVTL